LRGLSATASTSPLALAAAPAGFVLAQREPEADVKIEFVETDGDFKSGTFVRFFRRDGVNANNIYIETIDAVKFFDHIEKESGFDPSTLHPSACIICTLLFAHILCTVCITMHPSEYVSDDDAPPARKNPFARLALIARMEDNWKAYHLKHYYPDIAVFHKRIIRFKQNNVVTEMWRAYSH